METELFKDKIFDMVSVYLEISHGLSVPPPSQDLIIASGLGGRAAIVLARLQGFLPMSD